MVPSGSSPLFDQNIIHEVTTQYHLFDLLGGICCEDAILYPRFTRFTTYQDVRGWSSLIGWGWPWSSSRRSAETTAWTRGRRWTSISSSFFLEWDGAGKKWKKILGILRNASKWTDMNIYVCELILCRLWGFPWISQPWNLISRGYSTVKYQVLFCNWDPLRQCGELENPRKSPIYFEDFKGLAEIRVAQEW